MPNNIFSKVLITTSEHASIVRYSLSSRCPISHATYMGLIQYYQITCKPVNQAICIFIAVPIVYFVILFQ